MLVSGCLEERKTGIIPKSAFKIGHKINNKRKQTPEQINKRVKKTSKDKHWNWQGGKTKECDKVLETLKSINYGVKLVLKEITSLVKKTGISGGELVVHHINNFADFPELRTAIDNGITLSKKESPSRLS